LRYFQVFFVLIIFSIILLAACSNEEGISKGEEPMKPKELPDAFLDDDYERIYSHMSKEFQDEVSLNELRDLGEDFHRGVSTYKLQFELPYGDDAKHYAWIDDSGSKGILAIIDEEDIIQGLQIMPLAAYPETDEAYTKTTFQYPFEDEWFVFWGGTNTLTNYHYEFENQRYAYDFTIVKEDNSFEGDQTLNENYYAFGENYLAPADGSIVKVENNVEDNEPVGEMNEEQPLGNFVIIDHGNEEYSYLAHFKHQSIEVIEGDDVKQGDLLGLVGNSGNSSEPHIHFHVADSPDPTSSKSIRINFNQEEKFIRGDFIE